jgi:hypothetical protein
MLSASKFGVISEVSSAGYKNRHATLDCQNPAVGAARPEHCAVSGGAHGSADWRALHAESARGFSFITASDALPSRHSISAAV